MYLNEFFFSVLKSSTVTQLKMFLILYVVEFVLYNIFIKQKYIFLKI